MRKTRAIQDIGNIAVFKFKKPTFPNTQKGLSTFSGKEELRYWSFCVSGESTATNECLLDARASTVKGADGENYVVVIVGPQSENLRRQAEKRGFHYLSHSPHRTPILFFRQMFARNDFVGNLERVTSLPLKNAESERELDKYFAEKFIGSYAPTGRQCWLTSHFFESLCGVKIEGKAEIEND